MIRGKKEEGITIVALVVTIIILVILAGVSINTLLGDNGLITKAQKAKENYILASEEEQQSINQLTHILETGSTIPDEEKPKDELLEELTALKELLNKTTATEDKIVKNYVAYSKGKLMTGTMEDNGAVNSNLNCGQSYTIPAGYHNGSGIVTANNLESQTQATATAEDISKDKTAWVNGKKITGIATGANYEDAIKQLLKNAGKANISEIPGKSSYLTIVTPNDSVWSKDDSFTFNSGAIPIFADMNNNPAFLNYLNFTIDYRTHYAYEGGNGTANISYTVKTDTGLILSQNSYSAASSSNNGGDKTGSIPINISLFDYDIGDSRTIYVEATGKTHVGRGTPINSQGLASCSISAVKLSHIPLGE